MMVSGIAVTVLIMVAGLGILSYFNYLDAKEQTVVAKAAVNKAEEATTEAQIQLVAADHNLGLVSLLSQRCKSYPLQCVIK